MLAIAALVCYSATADCVLIVIPIWINAKRWYVELHVFSCERLCRPYTDSDLHLNKKHCVCCGFETYVAIQLCFVTLENCILEEIFSCAYFTYEYVLFWRDVRLKWKYINICVFLPIGSCVVTTMSLDLIDVTSIILSSHPLVTRHACGVFSCCHTSLLYVLWLLCLQEWILLEFFMITCKKGGVHTPFICKNFIGEYVNCSDIKINMQRKRSMTSRNFS